MAGQNQRMHSLGQDLHVASHRMAQAGGSWWVKHWDGTDGQGHSKRILREPSWSTSTDEQKEHALGRSFHNYRHSPFFYVASTYCRMKQHMETL